MVGGIVLGVIAVVVVAVVISSSSGVKGAVTGPRPVLKLGPVSALGPLQPAPSPGPLGPEGVPVPAGPALAPAGSPGPGQSVDGISCSSGEQTLFHVHTHLTIFVNGAPRQVPYGVGIAPPRQVQQTGGGPFVASGACFSWLHTHAADGIIHIESPIHATFTLGNFFNLWGQPLGPNQVGPAQGPVTAFYNGHHYLGNPQNIPLGDHTQIQLVVGRPLIAPQTISWSASGL